MQCKAEIFLEQDANCDVTLAQKLTSNTTTILETIRQKIFTLIPITIEHNHYAPQLPKGTSLLIRQATIQDLAALDETLMVLQGKELYVYYMTKNPNGYTAHFGNEHRELSDDVTELCQLYVVEIIGLPTVPVITP